MSKVPANGREFLVILSPDLFFGQRLDQHTELAVDTAQLNQNPK
jgi:hypothetical protein